MYKCDCGWMGSTLYYAQNGQGHCPSCFIIFKGCFSDVPIGKLQIGKTYIGKDNKLRKIVDILPLDVQFIKPPDHKLHTITKTWFLANHTALDEEIK